MRMPKHKNKHKQKHKPKQFQEEPEPYRHSGHIGPGPKPGPKRAVNVSIDAEILAAAKAQRINLSQTLEDILRKLTEPARLAKFQESIDSYNRLIERAGVFGEEFQDWDESSV
jgi:antitoxin CcdA